MSRLEVFEDAAALSLVAVDRTASAQLVAAPREDRG
jgi:hypothetical protein